MKINVELPVGCQNCLIRDGQLQRLKGFEDSESIRSLSRGFCPATVITLVTEAQVPVTVGEGQQSMIAYGDLNFHTPTEIDAIDGLGDDAVACNEAIRNSPKPEGASGIERSTSVNLAEYWAKLIEPCFEN